MTRARKKVRVKTYRTLNEKLIDAFYETKAVKRWNGFRVLSIDGSMLTLPDQPEIIKYFGQWGSIHGYGATKARLSILYDTENQLIVDSRLANKGIAENRLMIEHLNYVKPGDLITADRGYQAFWIFKKILSKGADFCIRVSDSKWKVQLKAFMAGQEQETVIELKAPANSQKTLGKYRVDDQPIKVRLIKYEVKPGQIDILCTSVQDPKITAQKLVKLYHHRWRIEENYKVIKSHLSMEKFTGKSRQAILQEFLARVFMLNLGLLIRQQSDRLVASTTKHRKHRCKANLRQLLCKLRGSGILIFFSSDQRELLWQLIHEGAQEITEYREGRSSPRNKKVKRKVSQSYPGLS